MLTSTHLRQLNNKLNEMSSQIDMTGLGNEPFKDEYANWRRQRKYCESEIKRLKGEVGRCKRGWMGCGRSNYKGIWQEAGTQ